MIVSDHLPINAQIVLALHDHALASADWPQSSVSQPVTSRDSEDADAGRAIRAEIEANHRFNGMLWAEEDLARRREVPDAEIAANKRAIDKFNQSRNDAIERIDEHLLAMLDAMREGACLAGRLNSETAGSMCDRLSIVSLKIRAMREQTERADASEEHRAQCAVRLDRLRSQRTDLAQCFDELLSDCAAGRAQFRIYRQFKMYNDPTMNPYLYRKA